MNGSQQSLSFPKQNLQYPKTYRLEKKQQSAATQEQEDWTFIIVFANRLTQNNIVLWLFSLSIFDSKWSSSIISKAC